MRSHEKTIDTFQIVGFALSIAISVGLIATHQDTIQSVILGLILTTLTQLFDLQIRHGNSEDRLMQANALSQALYSDAWLLEYIQEIVNSYLTTKSGWFDLFRLRANDAIVECRNILHSMVEGNMVITPPSLFSFGETFGSAEKSIKHASAIADISYWRSIYADKALQWNATVIRRGVSFTRIFIQPLEALRQMVDILERQQSVGIDVFIVLPDDLPPSARQDYIIVDDRASARQEVTIDGKRKAQRISIDPVEVERLSKEFDLLKYHAVKLDEVIGTLK